MVLSSWISVDPVHCHQRVIENTLVEKVRILNQKDEVYELQLKFKPEDLFFFFDHEIDHLPGMLEISALRQSALAVAHLVHNVPMDYMIILDWIDVKWHCFAELNVNTTAKLSLLQKKEQKSRVELVLDGIILQGDKVVMEMRGKLLAFAPKISKKIRSLKVSEQEVFLKKKINEHSQSQMVEVHLVVDELASVAEDLQKELSSGYAKNYEVKPLYFSFDEEDLEIRICCLYDNPKLLGDYVVDRIRCLKGVKKTRVRLTLDGKVYLEGVRKLTQNDGQISSHIYLEVDPVCDGRVWEILQNLKVESAVFPTWCMRDFYDYDRNISLRLVGKSKDEINLYIKNQIQNIDGIKINKIKFMGKLIKIESDENLLRLAKRWM